MHCAASSALATIAPNLHSTSTIREAGVAFHRVFEAMILALKNAAKGIAVRDASEVYERAVKVFDISAFYECAAKLLEQPQLTQDDENNIKAMLYFFQSHRADIFLRPSLFLFAEKAMDIVINGVHIFGTTDCVTVTEEGCDSILNVIDYKHGMKLVNPKDNPQLYLYALMALSRPKLPRVNKVRVTIIQPNAIKAEDYEKSIKDHILTVDELYAWRDNTFAPALKNAHDIFVRFQGGEYSIQPNEYSYGTHCKYCTALPICPAVKNLVQSTSAITDSGWTDRSTSANGFASSLLEGKLKSLAVKDLHMVLRLKDIVDSAADALENLIMTFPEETYDNIEIKQTRAGNRVWAHSEDPIIPLVDTEEVLTPTQAIQRKIFTRDEVELLTTQSDGKNKFIIINNI